MTMTPLERAEDAFWDEFDRQKGENLGSEPTLILHWEPDVPALIRAVLAAIREPNEAAAVEGYKAIDGVLCKAVGTEEAFTEDTQMKAAVAAWQAMIDAALDHPEQIP